MLKELLELPVVNLPIGAQFNVAPSYFILSISGLLNSSKPHGKRRHILYKFQHTFGSKDHRILHMLSHKHRKCWHKNCRLVWRLRCYEQPFGLLKHRCLHSPEGFLGNRHILRFLKIHNTHQNIHYMPEHTYCMPRYSFVSKCPVDSQ